MGYWTDLDVDVGGNWLVVGVDDGAVLDEDAVGGRLQVDRNLLQGGSRIRRHLGNCLENSWRFTLFWQHFNRSSCDLSKHRTKWKISLPFCGSGFNVCGRPHQGCAMSNENLVRMNLYISTLCWSWWEHSMLFLSPCFKMIPKHIKYVRKTNYRGFLFSQLNRTT